MKTIKSKGKTLLILVLLCCCWSCDVVELEDGYYYLNCTIWKKVKVEGKYDASRTIVPKEVLNFNYDNYYIIAYQKPAYDVANKSMRETASQTEKDSLDEQMRKILEIDDCYWIIRKVDCVVWGPMPKSEFEDMCKKKGIKIVLDPKYEQRRTLKTPAPKDIWGEVNIDE
jgi:hypothetical protein